MSLIVSLSSFPVAANLVDGRYRFIQNLLALEAASTLAEAPHSVPQVRGYLPLAASDPFLSSLPDRDLAGVLRRGIISGFRIGVPPHAKVQAAKRNITSAMSMPHQVDKYIQEELKTGNLVISQEPLTHTSPIGLIPKKHRPGKFRMIVDLSSPAGWSINDAINPNHTSFQYMTVRQVAERIPQGWFLSKLDFKSAYRKVPIHPSDSHWLGISWKGITYQDRALPFDLSSAPLTFTAVADGLAWAMLCSGIPRLAHYLDDFIFWAPDASSGLQDLLSAVELATRLGLPVEPSKVEGPSTSLTFLGIEVDTVSRELRLPKDKLLRLKGVIEEWRARSHR